VRSESHPVVAVKGARVGDFNGKTLSTISGTQLVLDPAEVAEAGRLRNWYDNGGAAAAVAPMSEARGAGGGRQDARITLAQVRRARGPARSGPARRAGLPACALLPACRACLLPPAQPPPAQLTRPPTPTPPHAPPQIQDDGLGMRGGAEWVTVGATVNFIRQENMLYAGCPLQFNGRSCNKKLTGDEGSWYCERCQQPVPQPSWRYIVSMQVRPRARRRGCGAAWLIQGPPRVRQRCLLRLSAEPAPPPPPGPPPHPSAGPGPHGAEVDQRLWRHGRRHPGQERNRGGARGAGAGPWPELRRPWPAELQLQLRCPPLPGRCCLAPPHLTRGPPPTHTPTPHPRPAPPRPCSCTSWRRPSGAPSSRRWWLRRSSGSTASGSRWRRTRGTTRRASRSR
jgi:hypothetical protein